MTTSTSSRLSLLRLLKAARGACNLKATQRLKPAIDPLKLKRSGNLPFSEFHPLPCFPLKAKHFGSCTPDETYQKQRPSTPSEFHSTLCDLIRNAKHRVTLASLYIGTGGSNTISPKENELLDAIEFASSKDYSSPKINILLDANRSLRPIKNSNTQTENEYTSSAEAVYARLQKDNVSSSSSSKDYDQMNQEENRLHLFNVLDFPRSLLPSPLNEVVGVFHLKAYIIDDNLILSGANLSEEYFTDRQDRYMLFVKGGGGLVNFYSNLIDILCEYANTYNGANTTKNTLGENEKKQKFRDAVSKIFDCMNENSSLKKDVNTDATNLENKNCNEKETEIVAYAIPTLQLPKTFISTPLQFLSDTHLLQHIIYTAVEEFKNHASIRISSAYLNPTLSLMEALKLFGSVSGTNAQDNHDIPTNTFLLSAGPESHGFSPKKKVKVTDSTGGHHNTSQGKGRDWIPKAFATVANQIACEMASFGGKVLLFERTGWTFHSKGFWLSKSISNNKLNFLDCGKITEREELLLSIIGSGNYGARSEDLDVESNCILVLNPNEQNTNTDLEKEEKVTFRNALEIEWNFMCEYSKELKYIPNQIGQKEKNIVLNFALPIVRRFL